VQFASHMPQLENEQKCTATTQRIE
jgi:hypothetical protein